MRIPVRSIPVHGSPLGVVLIAIVGAGHDHTVFSAQLPKVPGKPSRLLWSSTDPEVAQRRTVMRAACSPMSSPDKFARRIPRLGQCMSIAPGRPSLSLPGSTHLVSANASDTEPASLLAVFVADDHAQLTQPA